MSLILCVLAEHPPYFFTYSARARTCSGTLALPLRRGSESGRSSIPAASGCGAANTAFQRPRVGTRSCMWVVGWLERSETHRIRCPAAGSARVRPARICRVLREYKSGAAAAILVIGFERRGKRRVEVAVHAIIVRGVWHCSNLNREIGRRPPRTLDEGAPKRHWACVSISRKTTRVGKNCLIICGN